MHDEMYLFFFVSCRPRAALHHGVHSARHQKKKKNKELGGWETGGRPDLSLFSVMMMMIAMSDDWSHRKPRPLPTQRPCTTYLFILVLLLLQLVEIVAGEKDDSATNVYGDRDVRKECAQQTPSAFSIPNQMSQF